MDSMEEIYKNHAKTVYGFLLTRTHDPDEAMELTQETFCRAVACLNGFRGESSVSTWLCGIAKNVWLEHVKKQRRRWALEKTEAVPDAEAVGKELQGSPENTHVVMWENLRVLKALHRLKEPVRETIYLRLVGNLTFAQIGEIMGKSENWARVTFYRGKEMIIKEVKKDE